MSIISKGHFKKIYIAGHRGFVGCALARHFAKNSAFEIIAATREQLDLTDQKAVEAFLAQTKPDVVIAACGKVGGIHTNATYPADFIYQNLMMEANLIHGAWKTGTKRLLNFGSACIYPKICTQPMTPDLLMTGKIETTNEPYAIAKLAGLSLCTSYNKQYETSFITAIPSNLYGPGDSFDLEKAHVVPSLIRKFHEAMMKGLSEVTLWSSGQAKRDFLFVDDVAWACEILLKNYDGITPINIGAGKSTMIKELADLIAEMVGFRGRIQWDTSKPDGAPERFLSSSEVRKLGWIPQTDLKSGLQKTYGWFLKNWAREEKREQCASL
ncbi:MAG: GDP-fucose synthetase [Deltaproteobacteria bacterium RIFCSPLOWO2_01_44_7]|nr:MAG: GDP-fucose synthetase [Deltaproteobacteria bacterium RIFCSPHIGHO2_01_FULL_43_49]OGQ16060.1 MAG: GDP-fucose synthetase [Deltaproteobacteria bacterium RIFCSPHIGHO2_02_FULL_44_53]OGQ29021.1 MAG: GDP-fucose synthetase [Deltaproteobacteria bacterium RIFCSPHIGHO2_12_FULL_44_21]OGQ32577.1 MAG: GDP-fucose synthetase [Deltaproteobacteria bacterium RIFCSPLOWO2_01_FULL_45_74]OGQ38319.1 MAG: GDP-fucose synthetase [Deltaproteobacteria bacterium RIFCSPLOWO2_01_44_7]OGQ41678.1 MAG: GDP-fucose synthet